MEFFDYTKDSEEYAKIGIDGTYYLAYSPLKDILRKFVKGKNALDYGCGTGRSTRFLKQAGFEVVGVDINSKMIEEAKKLDLYGDYVLVKSGDLSLFDDKSFDLILSAFTFDSIFSIEEMVKISKEMRRVLKKEGIIINITSTPELYSHNWNSFVGKFPENIGARGGDRVKIAVRGTNIIVEDYIWFEEDYKKVFEMSGLELLKIIKPLGKKEDKFKWLSEKKSSPWFIFVLRVKPDYRL